MSHHHTNLHCITCLAKLLSRHHDNSWHCCGPTDKSASVLLACWCPTVRTLQPWQRTPIYPHLDPPLPGVKFRGTPPVWGVHRTQCAQVVTGRCLGGRDRGYPPKDRFYPSRGVAGLTKQYIFWQTSPTIGYPPLPPFQKWGFPLIIPKLTKKSGKKCFFWGQKCVNNDRNGSFPEFPTFCTFSCFWVAFSTLKTTPIKV